MADDRRDDDLTEIRRLLSTMADSHPVPDDLAARITDRIEAEDRDRRSHCHFDPAVSSPGRRRSGVAVSAGLLSVAVALVSAAVVFHIDDEAVSAQASRAFARLQSIGPTSAHDERVDAQAERPTPTPSQESHDDEWKRPSYGVVVLTSGVDYHRGQLTEQVRDLLSRRPIAAEAAHTRPDTGDPLPTPLGSSHTGPSHADVLRCLEALSLDPRRALVDVATFDGAPAMVLVADHGTQTSAQRAGGAHSRTIAVVPSTCPSDGTATPLAGPYRVH